MPRRTLAQSPLRARRHGRPRGAPAADAERGRARWTGEEVDDVSLYLNGKYYRYPCPPRVCKVISLATPAR
ncbi:MAG: hypothetical protein ABIQ84_04775 [Usitatibacter sp.]